MLSIAAREADIVSVNARTTATGGLDFTSFTAKTTGRKIASIRAAAGNHLADIELNLVCVAITITGGRLRTAEEAIRAYRLEGVSIAPAPRRLPVSLRIY